MAIARITSKGQITIPKEVRDHLGVEPGDALDFRVEDGRVEVWPVRRRHLVEFRGLFSVSKALDFTEERAQARTVRGRRLTELDEPADA